MNEELIEKLAEIEHEQWAHWTKYLFSKLDLNVTPSSFGVSGLRRVCSISEDDYKRWSRQIQTPYRELSEKEKESDREWARKVVEAVQDFGINEVFSDEDVTTFIERYG